MVRDWTHYNRRVADTLDDAETLAEQICQDQGLELIKLTDSLTMQFRAPGGEPVVLPLADPGFAPMEQTAYQRAAQTLWLLKHWATLFRTAWRTTPATTPPTVAPAPEPPAAPSDPLRIEWEATCQFSATVSRSEWDAMDDDERHSYLGDLEDPNQRNDVFDGLERSWTLVDA